jgi:hypothetical protein
LIEQLAAPRPATEGIQEPRTGQQRTLTRCWRSAGWPAPPRLPRHRRETPHLTVTIDWDALRTSFGVATLDYGTHISATQARRWACDAKSSPLSRAGNPNRSTSAGPCAPFRWPFAARLSPEIADVRFRAAICRREGARRITA